MEKPTSSVRADAIVVAAGSSSRMGGVDKQVAPVGGRPLLAWTLAGLAASPVIERIVVVISADRADHVRDAGWLPAAVAAVVAGGARRQESVAAGATELERDPWSGRIWWSAWRSRRRHTALPFRWSP
jgi:2-C-methyl-D-erythritol 4-phosphate cytidylyltransferase